MQNKKSLSGFVLCAEKEFLSLQEQYTFSIRFANNEKLFEPFTEAKQLASSRRDIK